MIVTAAHQSFADNISGAGVAFEFGAEVIIQIHAPFDDLPAAIAFDVECVIVLLRFGRIAAEKIFEKAHK